MQLYIGDSNDNKNPIECDYSADSEANRNNIDRSTKPDKHPAVESAGDVAFICNNCHTIICKNCVEEYSDTETPTSERLLDSPSNNVTNFSKELSNYKKSSDTTLQNPSTPSISNKDITNENSVEVGSKNISEQSTQSSRSLIDDYADLSSELPNYTGED